jgi:hypothetical protein
MIDDDDDNPYYDDTIMKYMSRPHLTEFDNLTYFQYFEQYSITPSPPRTTQQGGHPRIITLLPIILPIIC